MENSNNYTPQPYNLIKYDKYTGKATPPSILLKTKSFRVIGNIPHFENFSASLVGQGLDEISFEVHKHVNGELCPVWDDLIDLKVVDLRGVGQFEIEVSYTDNTETVKSIHGTSLECELGQLLLREFHVNDEVATTDKSMDLKWNWDDNGNFIPTVLYIPDGDDPKTNERNHHVSLLHRVLLDKAPHWSIGHVTQYVTMDKDKKAELSSKFQRMFTVDGTSIYDFLTGDLAQEANIVFTFDTYNRKINCYSLYDCYSAPIEDENRELLCKSIGEDTSILVSKYKLGKEFGIQSDKDSVKNCFYVEGGDDIITDMVRVVNVNGSNKIYQFADFQVNDMSPELVEKFNSYQQLLIDSEESYSGKQALTDFVEGNLSDYSPSIPEIFKPNGSDGGGRNYTIMYQGDGSYKISGYCFGMDATFEVGTINYNDTYKLCGTNKNTNGFYLTAVDANGNKYVDSGDGVIIPAVPTTVYINLKSLYSTENDVIIRPTAQIKNNLAIKIEDSVDGYFLLSILSEEVSTFRTDYDAYNLAGKVVKFDKKNSTIVEAEPKKPYITFKEWFSKLGIFTRLSYTYDVQGYINSSMMPSISIANNTTAEEQYKTAVDVIKNTPIGVYELNNYKSDAFTSVTKNVIAMGECAINARYKIEAIEDLCSYRVTKKDEKGKPIEAEWIGQFSITRTIDETEFYPKTDEQKNILVRATITDDELTYTRQKLDKSLQKADLMDIHEKVKKICDIILDDAQKIKTESDRIKFIKEELNKHKKEIYDYFNSFSLNRLKGFYEGYVSCDGILETMKQTVSSPVLKEMSLVYDFLTDTVSEVYVMRENESQSVSEICNRLSDEQKVFQASLDFEKYLGTDLYKEFAMFIREDVYNNQNYISDNLDTTSEWIDQAKKLLEVAKKEIKKSCVLQRTVSVSLCDLLLLPEFENLWNSFELYNYIRVRTDDEIFKMRIIGVDYSSDSPDDITVTFSDEITTVDGKMDDVQNILKQSQSIATTYSSTKLQAEKGKDANNTLTDYVKNGLDATNTLIKNGADSEVTITNRGLIAKKMTDEGEYSNNQLMITGNGMYLTEDNWENIVEAVGEFVYEDPTTGEQSLAYGILADKLVGNVVASKEMIIKNKNGGVQIDEDKIEISNGYIYLNKDEYSIEIDPKNLRQGGKGNFISVYNKNDGTDIFYINKEGKAYFSGSIKANSGEFGGVSIDKGEQGFSYSGLKVESYTKMDYNDGEYYKDYPITVVSEAPDGSIEQYDGTFRIAWDDRYGVTMKKISYKQYSSVIEIYVPSTYNSVKINDNITQVSYPYLINYSFLIRCDINPYFIFKNKRYELYKYVKDSEYLIDYDYYDDKADVFINAVVFYGGWFFKNNETGQVIEVGSKREISEYHRPPIQAEYKILFDKNVETTVYGKEDVSYTIINVKPNKVNIGDSIEYDSLTDSISLSSIKSNLIPKYSSTYNLGSSDYRWNNIYSSTSVNTTSDRELKTDIEYDMSKYVELFDKLKPCSFKYINGSSGRIHTGYIAQDVEDAMKELGINDLEFAGLCKDYVDGKEIYSLRYDEFEPLYDAKIRQLEDKINRLEKLLERGDE